MVKELPPMLQVGDVIVHTDIITERFACDISACVGRCCEEGDAGAPVTMDEIARIESSLDDIWPAMRASAQAVVDKQGVAYADPEGELVTSIVDGGDCVFRGPKGCLLPEKPISCHLYPIREKRFGGGLVTEITGTFPDLKAKISFDDYGEKYIMLKYAKLRIVK